MYKITVLITLLFLIACGQSEPVSNLPITETTNYELTSSLQSNETADFEFAPELLFHQELADMFTYEISVSLEGEFIVRDTAIQHPEHLFSVTFPIEYFDGKNWVVIPPTDEFLARKGERPSLWKKGPIFGADIYDFALITDAGFDIETGLFRIRERFSLSDDFPEDESHDLVFEFSLSDVGTTIRNIDVADLKVNPDLVNVVLIMELLLDEHKLSGEIINHSDIDIGLGLPSLEYYNGEEWRYVTANISFALIGFMLPPGFEHQTGLFLEDYEIPEGYPLRFRIYVYPDGEFDSDLQHDLVFEFTLD